MIIYLHTNLFDSPAQTLVNTVNTVGVMGKGIALEFKTRFPDMFEAYKLACEDGELTVGKLHIWRTSTPWVLNFPTKTTWRKPSTLDYIERGLETFCKNYRKAGITSISFPPLGCGNGQLNWNDVRPLMERYLSGLEIDIYIHDKQVSPFFSAEHLVKAWEMLPPTFDEFARDIHAEIHESKGQFRTLVTNAEFVATSHSDGIEIKAAEKTHFVPTEYFEWAWSALQTKILTADIFSDAEFRASRPYLFAILAGLPYVRLAVVHKQDSVKPIYALFLAKPNRSSDTGPAIPGDQPCLFRGLEQRGMSKKKRSG